jgi:hypothetical protein
MQSTTIDTFRLWTPGLIAAFCPFPPTTIRDMGDWFGHWPEWLFAILCVLGGSAPALLGFGLMITLLLVPVGMLLGIGLWLVVLICYAWICEHTERRKAP